MRLIGGLVVLATAWLGRVERTRNLTLIRRTRLALIRRALLIRVGRLARVLAVNAVSVVSLLASGGDRVEGGLPGASFLLFDLVDLARADQRGESGQ